LTAIDIEMRTNVIDAHDSLVDIFDIPSYEGEFYDVLNSRVYILRPAAAVKIPVL